MKIYWILVIVILGIGMVSCRQYNNTDNCHYYINFVNNSNKDIFVHTWNSYPDTTLSYRPGPDGNPEWVIPMHTRSDNALFLRRCFEWDFSNGVIPSDTMMVFVYDLNVLNTTSWDTIKKYNMILKRYDLSLDDLQRMNWTITYP